MVRYADILRHIQNFQDLLKFVANLKIIVIKIIIGKWGIKKRNYLSITDEC